MPEMMKTIKDTITALGLKFDEIIDMDRDTVFTSGSRIEGLANHMSDFDFFVISDRAKGPYKGMVIPMHHGSYVDIEFLSHEQINSLISTINRISIDNYDEVAAINLRDMDTYYRTLIAEPVVNEEIFRALQSKLSREIYTQMLEVRYGLECQDNLRKAELEDGMEVACRFIELAVGAAVDSVLVTHGEFYPHPKWRFEKIARALGTSDPLYQKAWRLKAPGNMDIGSYISEGKRFCRELSMDKYPKPDINAIRYTHAKNVQLVESYNRAFLIKDGMYICNISDQVHYLWPFIGSGSTKEALSSLIQTRFNLDAKQSTHLVSESLKLLQAYGLIEKQYAP